MERCEFIHKEREKRREVLNVPQQPISLQQLLKGRDQVNLTQL